MSKPDTITLNGRPHPLEASVSVAVLLDTLGLAGKPVAVELDEQAILPADHARVMVAPGARVEIVALAAGG
ncbi:MAG TPA: sulfur carrier protein ThiS [Luteolibacter sp.]|nr:sulfur carrier protein ThiS [Luteolibacter sp.]